MTTNPLGLAVTTSTGVTGVGVGRLGGDDQVASRLTDTDRRHAEELTPLVLEVLDERGLAVSDLDVLIVDIGPGRFTGLRVGLATIRALAFAADLPVVGLTSLEILAAGAPDAEQVTAVVDARRGEVFQQVFTKTVPDTEPTVGPAVDLVNAASGVVVGDGVDLYHDVYQAAEGGLRIVTGNNPDPVVMLAMAAEREAKEGSTIAPLYLRDPDVNPNVKTRPVADRHGGSPAGGAE